MVLTSLKWWNWKCQSRGQTTNNWEIERSASFGEASHWVWVSLLRLLPPRPDPEEDGWMDSGFFQENLKAEHGISRSPPTTTIISQPPWWQTHRSSFTLHTGHWIMHSGFQHKIYEKCTFIEILISSSAVKICTLGKWTLINYWAGYDIEYELDWSDWLSLLRPVVFFCQSSVKQQPCADKKLFTADFGSWVVNRLHWGGELRMMVTGWFRYFLSFLPTFLYTSQHSCISLFRPTEQPPTLLPSYLPS